MKFKEHFNFFPPLFHKRFCDNTKKQWMQIFVSGRIERQIQNMSCDDEEEALCEQSGVIESMVSVARYFGFTTPACVLFMGN